VPFHSGVSFTMLWELSTTSQTTLLSGTSSVIFCFE